MRTEAVIKKLILDVATADNRVRAVLMNGSRVNSNIVPDKYQDYDIVFIVNHLPEFTADHTWVNVFGNIILQQLPDQMVIGVKDPVSFGYLMIFDDGNRIDLTLYPADKVTPGYWPDSLTACLLDKDHLFDALPAPNEADYFIRRPSFAAYRDTCNEFWWVSTYVAKGLLRKQITYAKEMFDSVVRPMLLKLVEWKIGIDYHFAVSFGKAGKNMAQFLTEEAYISLLRTYTDADIENNWQALFHSATLFKTLAKEVAEKLHFEQDIHEQENTILYLHQLYHESRK